mmetsp:Transcript_1773/g.4271  ORF Transcript_1773/g.4271 Transcript_1773/m.4271 type:complete len:148 (-) Transcript_1773:431-874(-)
MPGAAARKKKRAAMRKLLMAAVGTIVSGVDDMVDAVGGLVRKGNDIETGKGGGHINARDIPQDMPRAEPAGPGTADGQGGRVCNVNVHVTMLNRANPVGGGGILVSPHPFAASGAVLGFPAMPPPVSSQGPLIVSVIPASNHFPVGV